MPCRPTCPRLVLVDDEEFTHKMMDLVLSDTVRVEGSLLQSQSEGMVAFRPADSQHTWALTFDC